MGPMTQSANRRQFPRVAVQGHLRYRRIPIGPVGPRNVMVDDVSRGGFRFHTDEFLNRSSSLLLEMYLPGTHPVRSLATVAWVRELPEEHGYEVGGAFVEPPREARASLEAVVSLH